ncbi:hypothetical protein SDC9_200929 [bioreactor metagenome]|uniref:Uncharacterized protein n=1 Tax=bioreactor metagenome TaxID=1076179 RepID=A0A645IPJ3_9ZZZZ
MSVTISGGKITAAKFSAWSSGYEISDAILAYIPESSKELTKNIMDEAKAYSDKLASTGDASKVAKIANPTQGIDVFGAFVSDWNDIAKQCGGTAVSATATTSTDSTNPKTGDGSIVVFVIAAVAALSAMFVIGKKQKVTA